MEAGILTAEQIQVVHEVSLAILERIGVVLPHPEVLARLADSGAKVDRAAQRVWIPPELVMDLVGQAGKEFTIYGRDTSLKAEFGCGKRNYNSTAGQASWVEEPGGPRRYSTLEDVATASRLGDALDGINVVGAMADPSEVPVSYRCVGCFGIWAMQ